MAKRDLEDVNVDMKDLSMERSPKITRSSSSSSDDEDYQMAEEPADDTSIDMNIPAPVELSALESLNYDCLRKIFRNLSFNELVPLRRVCSKLNSAVCDFLLERRSFGVMLTSEESEHRHFQKFMVSIREHDPKRPCPWLTGFGPGAKLSDEYYRAYLRGQNLLIRDCYDHFKPEDFIFMKNGFIESFTLFIQNRMPDLTKLALIIDLDDYFSEVPSILKSLKNLEFLYLNSSHIGFSQVERKWSFWSFWPSYDYPTEIFKVLESLQNLKALYYFPREFTAGMINGHPINRKFKNFHKNMMSKLEAFHTIFFQYSVKDPVNENIRQLTYGKQFHKSMDGTKYPNLEKFIFFKEFLPKFNSLKLETFPNLKTIDVYDTITINEDFMNGLNQLPSLEKIACRLFQVHKSLPDATPDAELINRTVKEVFFHDNKGQQSKKMKLKEYLKIWPRFFGALEEITVEDIEKADDYPIPRRFQIVEAVPYDSFQKEVTIQIAVIRDFVTEQMEN